MNIRVINDKYHRIQDITINYQTHVSAVSDSPTNASIAAIEVSPVNV